MALTFEFSIQFVQGELDTSRIVEKYSFEPVASDFFKRFFDNFFLMCRIVFLFVPILVD